MQYQTKDSGKRVDYKSGMRRDTQEGKPDFALCLTDYLPYDRQLLTRWAALMSRGAQKYGRGNWQLADSPDELDRFKSSAFRHFMQWLCGEDDEDHSAAVLFNINAAESVKFKLEQKEPKDNVQSYETKSEWERIYG
jgi:hypothetical protein